MHELYVVSLFVKSRFIDLLFPKEETIVTKLHPYRESIVCQNSSLKTQKHIRDTVWIKKYKDCYFCSLPQSRSSGKILLVCLNTGWWIIGRPHQKSVFNDPVFKKLFWVSLCLDGALCAESQVVDQDTNEGSNHFSRHPWAIPCTL